MLIGNPAVFAIESEITRAYDRSSSRALGFFVLHVQGRRFGIKSPEASMLAVPFDDVAARILARGNHKVPCAEANATEVAEAVTRAIYLDHSKDETFFGMSDAQFKRAIFSNRVLWGPGLDECFDDGSYLLHFDIREQVRIIAFSRPDAFIDPASVREVWLAAHEFYSILQQWHNAFLAEWVSAAKIDPLDM